MPMQLGVALSVAVMALDAGELTEERLPSGARLALERRRADLTAALAPAPPQRVSGILANLSTMPARAEDDPEKRRFIVDQMAAICSDAPEWALEAAVWAFLRHEAGEGWFPSAGEVRADAMRRVEGYAAELAKIDRVLRARIAPPSKPASAEQRRALADRLRDLGEKLAKRGAEAERARGAKTEMD